MYWLPVNTKPPAAAFQSRLGVRHFMSGTRTKDASAPRRPLRILIAEDNRADLELTIRELESPVWTWRLIR